LVHIGNHDHSYAHCRQYGLGMHTVVHTLSTKFF